MHIRTRVAAAALAALAAAGCAAGTAAAQATPHAPEQLIFASQLTAIRFFTRRKDR
jgi:ABC-type sugar transport system substrate-binding protein